jgi:hypothetical protein
MAEWYGSALVLGSDQGLPAALVARLPPEHDRRTVLVLAGAPTDIVAALREALPADTRSIRLAASYGARTRLAQQVSDELEIEVVSPSGPCCWSTPAPCLWATAGLG